MSLNPFICQCGSDFHTNRLLMLHSERCNRAPLKLRVHLRKPHAKPKQQKKKRRKFDPHRNGDQNEAQFEIQEDGF